MYLWLGPLAMIATRDGKTNIRIPLAPLACAVARCFPHSPLDPPMGNEKANKTMGRCSSTFHLGPLMCGALVMSWRHPVVCATLQQQHNRTHTLRNTYTLLVLAHPRPCSHSMSLKMLTRIHACLVEDCCNCPSWWMQGLKIYFEASGYHDSCILQMLHCHHSNYIWFCSQIPHLWWMMQLSSSLSLIDNDCLSSTLSSQLGLPEVMAVQSHLPNLAAQKAKPSHTVDTC